jgi:hypothetical protein
MSTQVKVVLWTLGNTTLRVVASYWKIWAAGAKVHISLKLRKKMHSRHTVGGTIIKERVLEDVGRGNDVLVLDADDDRALPPGDTVRSESNSRAHRSSLRIRGYLRGNGGAGEEDTQAKQVWLR